MYTYTWKKYLAVIRILLKRSATGEQVLSLNRIDFEKGNRIRKPLCSFSIELVKGKLASMSQSVPAKDLITVLLEDDVASVLVRQNHYMISLNSDFLLRISNSSPATGKTVSEASETDINSAG